MTEVGGLQNHINRLFDDPFFSLGVRFGGDEESALWNPKVDVVEKENQYLVSAELPGIEKDNISVDLKGRTLTLSGERKAEKEVKEGNYHCQERTYGRFCRSFRLPEAVDPEKVKAEFKNGILTVEVPKTENEKPKQITVH